MYGLIDVAFIPGQRLVWAQYRRRQCKGVNKNRTTASYWGRRSNSPSRCGFRFWRVHCYVTPIYWQFNCTEKKFRTQIWCIYICKNKFVSSYDLEPLHFCNALQQFFSRKIFYTHDFISTAENQFIL